MPGANSIQDASVDLEVFSHFLDQNAIFAQKVVEVEIHMNKKEKLMAVKKLMKEGLNVTEISKSLKLPRTTVHDIVKKLQKVSISYCLNCDEPFTPNKYFPNQKFCCDHCRRIYWRKKYKKLGTNKKILLTCNHCGRLFYADRKTVKFCSRECYLNEVSKHE